MLIQYTLDNLTIPNLYGQLNSHAWSGHNCMPFISTQCKIVSDNSHAQIICMIFLYICHMNEAGYTVFKYLHLHTNVTILRYILY